MELDSFSPIFSPSQTARWSTCPWLWEIEYRQGWVKRDFDNRKIAEVLGTAFGVGMAFYNRARTPKADDADARSLQLLANEAGKQAVAQLVESLDYHEDLGFNLEALADRGDLHEALRWSVVQAVLQDPTPSDWVVCAVEEPRPQWGWARADVVYRLPDATKMVRDYKYKLSLDKARYLESEFERYRNHPQVPQYVLMEEAAGFITTIVRAHPFAIYTDATYPSKERLAQWLESQRVKWGLMDRMKRKELPLYEADTHSTKFGPCVLADFCLKHNRDMDTLPLLGFIQAKRS